MTKKKAKVWTEDELMKTFKLRREDAQNQLLREWLNIETPVLSTYEETEFQEFLRLAKTGADFWNEETLKMQFISPLFHTFVKLYSQEKGYFGYYDKEISATVEGIYLQTEVDFMLAKGLGDIVETPYFHFQEYKRSRKSPPEPMAQLLEAFLIAQEKNSNGKPIYGLTITGRAWQFVVMEGKEYGVSYLLDATRQEDLLTIIAVLRKFKVILETDLLG